VVRGEERVGRTKGNTPEEDPKGVIELDHPLWILDCIDLDHIL
jgi:hypothetical protein